MHSGRGWSRPQKNEIRGEFGAYLVAGSVVLAPGEAHDWHVVADTMLDHPALVHLETELSDPARLKDSLLEDVAKNRDALRRKNRGCGWSSGDGGPLCKRASFR